MAFEKHRRTRADRFVFGNWYRCSLMMSAGRISGPARAATLLRSLSANWKLVGSRSRGSRPAEIAWLNQKTPWEDCMMKRLIAAALAARLAVPALPAIAQETLNVWWVKGFYKSEDDALFAAIKKFEDETGVKVELSNIRCRT